MATVCPVGIPCTKCTLFNSMHMRLVPACILMKPDLSLPAPPSDKANQSKAMVPT